MATFQCYFLEKILRTIHFHFWSYHRLYTNFLLYRYLRRAILRFQRNRYKYSNQETAQQKGDQKRQKCTIPNYKSKVPNYFRACFRTQNKMIFKIVLFLSLTSFSTSNSTHPSSNQRTTTRTSWSRWSWSGGKYRSTVFKEEAKRSYRVR